MKDYCPSFETFHLRRNKLKQLEPICNKTVGEQLQELNERAVSSHPNELGGIYAFHSKENDMIYIGSAKTNLKGRYNSHIKDLRNNEHANWQFQLIYSKYGIESLDFYVIEYCSADNCKKRELFYIHNLLPEINIADTLPNQVEYEEYRKIVEAVQDEWRHTQEGFEWNRKRVSHWFDDNNLRKILRSDMRNLWERLDSQKLNDSEKINEVLKVYKHFLPEKYWTELELVKFIKKRNSSKFSKPLVIDSSKPFIVEKSKRQTDREVKKRADTNGSLGITVIFIVLIILFCWLFS